jgi:hypothetical protein
MDKGLAFLKSQVKSAAIQHATFLGALAAHEDQADDPRFSLLCSRHMPSMREHQRMLEEYQSQLGGDSRMAKTETGMTVAAVRDLADTARESDYVRLVGDIVMARQSEDAFKTFREAGKMMGNRTLQEIGEIGERHHDAYVKEANRLVQHMFVERVQGIDDIDGITRQSAFTRLDATT